MDRLSSTPCYFSTATTYETWIPQIAFILLGWNVLIERSRIDLQGWLKHILASSVCKCYLFSSLHPSLLHSAGLVLVRKCNLKAMVCVLCPHGRYHWAPCLGSKNLELWPEGTWTNGLYRCSSVRNKSKQRWHFFLYQETGSHHKEPKQPVLVRMWVKRALIYCLWDCWLVQPFMQNNMDIPQIARSAPESPWLLSSIFSHLSFSPLVYFFNSSGAKNVLDSVNWSHGIPSYC